MIGKAKCIAHTGAAIGYGHDKENAQEIGRYDVVGDNPKALANDFLSYQNMNHRTSNNTISMVLSPEPKDGKDLSNEALNDITKDFLKEMNLDKNQWVAYVHTDKAHKHIHVYANRIDSQGKAYKDKFIGKQASQCADRVAQARGLTRAKQVELDKSQELKSTRERISDFSDKVVHENKPKSIESYIEQFNKRGKEEGLRVQKYINKQGNFQGLQYFKGDQKFKASEVGRHLSAKNMVNIADNVKSLLNPTGAIIKSITNIITKGFDKEQGHEHSL